MINHTILNYNYLLYIYNIFIIYYFIIINFKQSKINFMILSPLSIANKTPLPKLKN